MHVKSAFPTLFLLSTLILVLSASCSDDEGSASTDQLVFTLKFDPNQERLDNFGNPETIPANHAAQSPRFNGMGVHYIELSEKDDIPAYNGAIIYQSPMTDKGGESAIDFDRALYAEDGETLFSLDLSSVPPGTYEYVRMSLSYQNYDVDFRANNVDLTGTIASFIGSNTYIGSYQVKNETIDVNGNKKQGYWAFETDAPNVPVAEGQAPAGATTVPNPIFDSSPIPPGSCLVTGRFATPLIITGNENESINIRCSISINNSFEWVDNNANGTYEPLEGDVVVNMGVRGLIPSVQ